MIAAAVTIVARTLLMLVVLSAFGAAPAALLSLRYGKVARVALAPVFGLCVGICVFTTVLWWAPASKSSWLVPLLAVTSCGTALWLCRREAKSEPPDDDKAEKRAHATAIAQFALIAIVVAAPITYAFAVHSSTGPVGFVVGDAQGYVSEIDGMQHESIQRAIALSGTTAYQGNITQHYWSDYASNAQDLDATPIAANVDDLFGLWGTDTQSAFLIAYLLAGGLGLFGCIRGALRRSSWAAAIGGLLFGGAMFLQLFFDGSEGAITGLAITVPLLFVSAVAVGQPTWRHWILVAVTLAGAAGSYPLFIPAVGCAAAAVTGAAAVRAVRGRFSARELAIRTSQVLAAVVLAFVISPIAGDRALRYWLQVLHGRFVNGGLPSYTFLTPTALPGWLFQFRPFYDIASSSPSGILAVIVELLLPLIFLSFAIRGLRRNPLTWLIVVTLGASALLGGYERVAKSCSYCEDRSLLPITPLAIALVAIGLGSVQLTRRAWRRYAYGVAGATVLVGGGASAYSSLMRFRDGAYFLDNSARHAIEALPAGSTVELEGFSEGPAPGAEQGLVYLLAQERAWGSVSIPGDYNEDGSLTYLASGGLPLTGRQFRPGYSYVLTRFPSIHTTRRTVVADRGTALQRRTKDLDVTPDYGLSVPFARQDPLGLASLNPYVVEPIKFIVTGHMTGTTYVNLRFALFAGVPHVSVVGTGAIKTGVIGSMMDVCAETTGSSRIATATIDVQPSGGVELLSMVASRGHCRPQH